MRILASSLARATEVAVVLAMVALVGVVFVEVVLRYGFNGSLIVTEELSRYLMIWVAFLGAALCARERLHIRIDALVGLLAPAGRRLADRLAMLATLVFLVVLLVESLQMLPTTLEQDTTTLSVSMAWFYLALPVGCALMIFFVVAPADASRSPDSGVETSV